MLNNEATSIILNMVFFEVISRKCPNFNWHYTLLVPHSPRWITQACLRQFPLPPLLLHSYPTLHSPFTSHSPATYPISSTLSPTLLSQGWNCSSKRFLVHFFISDYQLLNTHIRISPQIRFSIFNQHPLKI